MPFQRHAPGVRRYKKARPLPRRHTRTRSGTLTLVTERYDTLAAHHYAAFRPPLHTRILERVIHPGESFQTGLDVGCGTGHSTLALRRHCAHVIGLDPSQAMLDAAQAHAGITYRPATGTCPSLGLQSARRPRPAVPGGGSLRGPGRPMVAQWSEGAQPGPVYADLYFTRHRLRAG